MVYHWAPQSNKCHPQINTTPSIKHHTLKHVETIHTTGFIKGSMVLRREEDI